MKSLNVLIGIFSLLATMVYFYVSYENRITDYEKKDLVHLKALTKDYSNKKNAAERNPNDSTARIEFLRINLKMRLVILQKKWIKKNYSKDSSLYENQVLNLDTPSIKKVLKNIEVYWAGNTQRQNLTQSEIIKLFLTTNVTDPNKPFNDNEYVVKNPKMALQVINNLESRRENPKEYNQSVSYSKAYNAVLVHDTKKTEEAIKELRIIKDKKQTLADPKLDKKYIKSVEKEFQQQLLALENYK